MIDHSKRHRPPPGKTLGFVHNGFRCGCPDGTLALVDPFGGRFLCAECLASYNRAAVGEVVWPFVCKAKTVLGIGITGIGAFEEALARSAGMADMLGVFGAEVHFERGRLIASGWNDADPIDWYDRD